MTLGGWAGDARRWAPVAGVAGACLWVLFGWYPYNYGYGNHPVTVFESLKFVWREPEWEHAPLVLLIVPVLVYLRRRELAGVELERAPLAWLVWPLFIAAYWLGHQIDISIVSYLILHGFVVSCVWWFLGWRAALALAFPLAFLMFAWPMPFLNSLAFQLRILMSWLSWLFLHAAGLECVRSGTAILSAADPAAGLPEGAKFSVDIADPCSGIRSLFALMMVSALYAYFSLKTFWKQWVLFLCALPLAVAGNFFRILMLTMGAKFFGDAFAIGTLEEPSFYHMASGFAVFAVALAGMAGVAAALNRIPGGGGGKRGGG